MAPGIRDQLKNKLRERLQTSHIPSARLRGLPDCYKIKLRDAGYRLVYHANDKLVVVTVIAVGMRDEGLVYRLEDQQV